MRQFLGRAVAALACMAASAGVQALQIVSFTPQGEVARVRQAVAKFDAPAIRFGDPAAPAPFAIQCSDAEAGKGSGRWTGDREWVWDFAADLPPGVRCTATVRSAFKSASGAPLTGAGSYQFNSGGPFVQQIAPGTYQRIDENQFFALRLNGAATAQSVRDNVWCAVEGLGERVPVRPLDGAERTGLLKALGWDKAAAAKPLAYPTFACNRTLPPDARVAIVYGRGVATPSGIASTVEKRWEYRVREPFTVTFGCERENAQAACMPILPLRLQFNAPVTRKQAAAIRLEGDKGSAKPLVEGEEGDGDDAVVSALQFAGPFAERAKFRIVLPSGFQDASGRAPANAASFPLQVATGPLPPLAKFAASPFGIVERFAEPDSDKTGKALLPVTLRNVEAALKVQGLAPRRGAAAPAGTVSDLRPQTDADIVAWLAKVERYDETVVPRAQAARDVRGPLPPKVGDRDGVEARSVSLLGGLAGVKTLALPQPAGSEDPRPFEVVGIPLDPGFHVVEIASPRLGAALLDAGYGANRPMYVRTAALVTNLGVHVKIGRENAAVWVTTLDKGQPVPNAAVKVSDCRGKEIAAGTTDAQGIARIEGVSPEAPRCPGANGEDWGGRQAYFVSARAKVAGADDMAFAWSDSNRGIEPWRFNVPTSQAAEPDLVAHTVFDRTLLRAGETVSMKHYLRSQTRAGFGIPAAAPGTLVLTHSGSGQQFTQPLAWRTTATGGRSAESSFAVPPAAKLGTYTVALRYDAAAGSRSARSRGGEGEEGGGESDNAGRTLDSGSFRVEEFRLPVLEGRIAPADKKPLVHVASVPVQLQINYVAGGGAANLPVRVSALVRGKSLAYPDHDAFSFTPPRVRRDGPSGGGEGDEEAPQAAEDARVVADKLPVTLDRNGTGKATIADIPQATQPRELLLEATYSDPNGEVQTIRSTQTLWPAAVVAGIKTEGWVSVKQAMRFQALALGLDGRPQAGVALSVKATARITKTSRKRMVGGFYTYDNKTDTKDLGEVCSGKSDSRGLLLCEAKIAEAGEVELVATAKDGAGNTIQAASAVYVTKQGEMWFGGEDHDRIDLLPEKKSYEPGETARFQVRMPFRFATALVAVEREGIIETQVVQLNGQDPTVQLQVKDGWGPNVYVSVLAVRGRLREVPWYSFFTWGYKAPREWWTSFWYEGREYVAPTALVDLSKPAYRFGLAEIRVGTRAHKLDVQVKADKENYPVRGIAKVVVSAKLPDGKPAANAEVALAAVDQALLELMPNTSWNLLEAMLQRRSWGVETATAQMDIIGRRHYGRKAVPAGGGGGRGATRELLDTLLLWNPRVVLDANGQASIDVPLNDALTTFRIVAVADAGTGQFGTGETRVRATQDLQIVSGLPPLVREGDDYRAQITLRNTTAQPMKVEATARATLLDLQPQTVDIPAGESREIAWTVTAPEQLGQTRAEAILWEIAARDTAGNATARDALKARQRIVPAVPLTVQQATLVQIDGAFRLDVAPPAGALPATGAKRGGLKLALQPKLAEGLPGVRDWFANYPFICLEQKTSKAVGLADGKLWQTVAAQLPTYLDGQGLASYFPPRDGQADRGSDTLTAYLLAATHEASALHPEFVLPDAPRDAMLAGLVAFVEGRIQRDFWSPRKDLDVRKIAALEALSRYGRAQGRMVGSIAVAPNQWPTHAVIDWLNILKRVQDVPQRAERLAETQQILRARLSYQGTKLVFSTERDDYWWWLMANGDANTAKLMLAVMDDPAWRDDMGRLAADFIARQQNGAWHTTTANLWGGLALEKFSAAFESTPVAGLTRAALGGAAATVDWSRVERVKPADAAGAPNQTTMFGAPASPGNLRNNGMFLPWPATGGGALEVQQQGTGRPWLTVQSLAAVPRTAPFNAGYALKKTVTPVEQVNKGAWTRGDVLRVTLEVNATADMTWVVLSDPIPGGATILGGGLGRDSEIATQGEKKGGAGFDAAYPAFEERSFEAYRAYYEYVPKGNFKVEYTVRLNNVGAFALPPSRVEAMYAPEMFGEVPNARLKVEPAR
ncbi:MG2 domain-containing protein [uncultured Xylophilus sp.]|uniref:alpha-2-macroglobulin family protein n=1 Tax=uncultured Xylophilus sp. TaxID=296832 RepID=UPI0025E8CEC9|nr:MG2 domain-containing protein [uncultured Xylophilus sp.]